MASGTLTITNTTFPDNSTADGTQVITNFNDIVNFVENRNDGTAEWKVCNVTATVTAAMTITSDQATTLVQISNSATDGDPVLEWALGGTVQFAMGVDDGDSDVLKVGTTAIGTNTVTEWRSAAPHFTVISADVTTELTIDNTAADGDSVLSWRFSDTAVFSMGVDDGDSDKWKLGTTAIGTNTSLTVDVARTLGVSGSDGTSYTALTLTNDSTTADSLELLDFISGTTVGFRMKYRREATTVAHEMIFQTLVNSSLADTLTFTRDSTTPVVRVDQLALGGTTMGGSTNTVAIFNGTAPTGSVTNGVLLFAEDVSSSSELQVRDEAGNVTVLST